MDNKITFPQKSVKKSLTVRLPPLLLDEVERVKIRRKLSKAVLVEMGLKWVIENDKKQHKA
jgi:hypothetical protein